MFLRGPKERQIDPFGQGFGGELGRLITGNYRLDNLRCQEPKPQHSSDVAICGAQLSKVLHLFRFVPLKVKRRGVEMRLIINGGDEPRKPDPALLKAFARARGWFEELVSGRVRSLVEIARREGLAKRYVTRLTKLAFVSPAFVDAIAEGNATPGTNLQMLMDGRIALPPGWNDQEELFTD